MSIEKIKNLGIADDLQNAFDEGGFKQHFDFEGNPFPQHNNKSDLLKAIAEQKFDKISFVYDITKSKYTTISQINMKKQVYSGQGFLVKLAKAYERTFGVKNDFLESLDADEEKNFLQQLKFCLPAVEEFTSHPNKKNGVFEVQGFETYNHFNHNEKLVKIKEIANNSDKIKDLKEFNWKEYPEIEFLFRYLVNEKENKAFDYNNETSKYDIEVSLFEKLIHYFAALLDRTEKLGVAFTFQSPVQGVGKGIMEEEIIKPIIGSDFFTEVKAKNIIGDFNDAIDGKLFAIFNECKISKKEDKIVFNNNMKNYITDSMLVFNKKYRDAEMKYNFCNFMIFTNEDVPYYIESNCRRNVVVKTPFARLDAAVRQVLKMDIETFIHNIKKSRDVFYWDLLRFEYDLKFIKLKAPMTEAKRAIIQKTNTIATVIAGHIKGNNTEDLQEFLEVNAELSPEKIHVIMSETEAGFLTADSTEILFDVFKGFQTEEMNATKKNVYFENIFGKQTKIYWNDCEGKRKEKRAYKLPHYSVEKVQEYYTLEMKVEKLDSNKTTSFDFEGFSF